MKTKNLKIFKNKSFIIDLIFMVSLCCLSLILSSTIEDNSIIINYQYKTLSVFLTLCFAIYLVVRKFPTKYLKSKNYIINLTLVFLYIFDFFRNFKLNILNVDFAKVIDIIGKNNISIFVIIISGFSLYIIINYIIEIFFDIYKQLLNHFDNNDYKYLKIISIISFIIIFLLYGLNNGFWYGWDKIYSTDTHYVSTKMFSSIYWVVDIRHILFSIIISPIVVFCNFIKFIVPTGNEIFYPIIAYFNVILLSLNAIILKKITKNKYILYLYTVSFPFLLYSIFIEKYQIVTFLTILFLYSQKIKNNRLENLSLIASIGCMASNVFLGFLSNWQKKFKDTIVKWIKVAVLFIFITALSGRISTLLTFNNQIKDLRNGNPNPTKLVNRIYGCTEFLHSTMYAPSYKIVYNEYDVHLYDKIVWTNEASQMNYIGILIFVITTASFIINRKHKFVQIAYIWLCSGLSLFILFDWYSYEAPLFNILYSWAVLILLVMLINKIKNIKLTKIIYFSIIFSCCIINYYQLIEIISFILSVTV